MVELTPMLQVLRVYFWQTPKSKHWHLAGTNWGQIIPLATVKPKCCRCEKNLMVLVFYLKIVDIAVSLSRRYIFNIFWKMVGTESIRGYPQNESC